MSQLNLSGQSQPQSESPSLAAFEQGRRSGFATAALAVALVSFLSLLGVEKAILAIALAFVSLRSNATDPGCRRTSLLAIALAALFILSVIVLLAIFHDKLLQMVRLLQQLS